MITIYEKIKRSKKITGICMQCDKKKIRTISEEQTVNPFNKNKDGTTKSYHEVEMSVSENLVDKINKMQKEFYCFSCKKYI